MKIFFIICTTLLCVSFSTSSLTVENVLLEHREDLKLFLDWSHKFAEVFEIQKQKYMVELNSEEDIVVKALQTYKAQKILNLLYQAGQLRNVLVKGDNDYMIGDQLESNAGILAVFMGIMPIVLDDLKNTVEKWEKDKQYSSYTLTVMDEKPLEWLKNHGFDEASLNDLTIPLLKEKVEELCGDGKAFDSLLSFFGTLHTLICSVDIASKLAWLFTFGNNPKALYSLRKYLTREGSRVQPEITDKIIDSIRKLGDKEGPLSRLFGNGRDGGLYPFLMPILNKAVFFEEKGEQYMKVLVNVCSNISVEFGKFEGRIRGGSSCLTPTEYWEYGFLYDREKVNINKIFRYLDALTWLGGMLISNVEDSVIDAVIDYEHATRIVQGYRLILPNPLIMSGMMAMGITAV